VANEWKLYQAQVNFLEEFLEFHPLAVNSIGVVERSALLSYFGLQSEQNDLRQYRLSVIEDRHLQGAATDALRALLSNNQVEHSDRLLPPVASD